MPLSPSQILETFERTRQRTEWICSTLKTEDFVIQSMESVSPPRWHLGHTSWFFEMAFAETWPNYQPYSKEFHWFFNSYYERFGERIERARRGTRSRPTVATTFAYRSHVNQAVRHFLLAHPVDDQQMSRALELISLGIEHEIQHQELLVYDVKHLILDLYTPPEVREHQRHPTTPGKTRSEQEFVSFAGGLQKCGHDPHEGFAYDNESPAHKVWLEPFQLARRPVCTGEYLEFIQDGGYRDAKLWLSDGWKFVQENQIEMPLYWTREGDRYFQTDFFGTQEVTPESGETLAHISYYEASALSKWMGCRLPTEQEWEYAARLDADGQMLSRVNIEASAAMLNGVFLESCFWKPSDANAFPNTATPHGLEQMFGNVWEWTSSDYSPYPGFHSSFAEYNDKWMCNQRVLRGGSYATLRDHLRVTYRNFFYPHERWMVAGLRLARDS